jgi:hypothetical protein
MHRQEFLTDSNSKKQNQPYTSRRYLSKLFLEVFRRKDHLIADINFVSKTDMRCIYSAFADILPYLYLQ